MNVIRRGLELIKKRAINETCDRRIAALKKNDNSNERQICEFYLEIDGWRLTEDADTSSSYASPPYTTWINIDET